MKIKINNNRYLWFIVAFFACCIVFCWYGYRVRFGLGRSDEAFYLTIPQRILSGDKFLIDEWNTAQFIGLFNYIPYLFFVKITGGVDGIILFMRYVYLVINFLFYWYIIYKLRKYPMQAVIIAFVFCGFVPFAIFTISYYNFPSLFLLVICFIIIEQIENRVSPIKLVLSGCLYSGIVLVVPGLALLYFVVTAIIFANYIKGGHSKAISKTNIKIWFFFTLGVSVCALFFFIIILKDHDLKSVLNSVSYLFGDSEYQITKGWKVFFANKVKAFLNVFSLPSLLFEGVVLLFSFIMYRNKCKIVNKYRINLILFIVVCIFYIIVGLGVALKRTKDPSSMMYWFVFSVYPIPIFMLGVNLFFLCDKNDENNRFLVFLLAGFGCSLFRDVFSAVSVGLDFILTVVPCVFYFFQCSKKMIALAERIKVNSKKDTSKKIYIYLTRLVSLCVLVVMLLLSVWNLNAEGNYLIKEEYYQNNKECTVRLDEGVYKGIFTNEGTAEKYQGTINDLRRISQINDGFLYIPMLLPEAYLYANQPISSYSTWFVADDIDTRQIEYWNIFPGKRPEVIYIPCYEDSYVESDYSQFLFEKISDYFRYEYEYGESGIIVYNIHWCK